jgi:hypothetical protein
MGALLDLFCSPWFTWIFFWTLLCPWFQHVSHFSKKNVSPGPPLRSRLLGLLWRDKFGPIKTCSWVTFPFKFVKVKDFPKKMLRSRMLLIGGSLMLDSWTISVCYLDLFSSPWLLATWLLFLNSPLKFQLDKVKGRCWRMESCAIWILFCSAWMLATWISFSNPPVKLEIDKVDRGCWQDVNSLYNGVAQKTHKYKELTDKEQLKNHVYYWILLL